MTESVWRDAYPGDAAGIRIERINHGVRQRVDHRDGSPGDVDTRPIRAAERL